MIMAPPAGTTLHPRTARVRLVGPDVTRAIALIGVVLMNYHGYLNGAEGPRFMVRDGFTTDGTDFRVHLDFAVGGIDFRGAYRNAGA